MTKRIFVRFSPSPRLTVIPSTGRLVRVLHEHLSVPVTCKIRIYPGDPVKTVQYAKMLIANGCQVFALVRIACVILLTGCCLQRMRYPGATYGDQIGNKEHSYEK